MGEERSAYRTVCGCRILLRKTQGNIPLGELSVEGSISRALIIGIEYEGVDCIYLTQDKIHLTI
jgi:hypothetical protein